MKTRSLLLLLAFSMTSIGTAQRPEDRGRVVVEEARQRTSGFGDASARILMRVRGSGGAERSRELIVQTLEVVGGERTIVRFESPRDLYGTALLTHSRLDGSSDQWLYLPAFRRVKRIAGAARTGSFMGSEFAYEDVDPFEIDRYTYRLMGTDSLHGQAAWIVEFRPTDASSAYQRQLVWFDQEEYRALQIEYYYHHDGLLKTLHLRDYQRYHGRFWRPDEMEMINHRTGASTTLQWSDYQFGVGLAAGDFEPNRLSRGG